jgi:predicted DsbA family dithiol-disulfide isomerase
MERTPNTRRAHMLAAYATDHGRGDAIVEALFRAYFEDALDIGDPAVLVGIAEAQGLDPEAARAVLGSEELTSRSSRSSGRAAEMGIGGVPFFILEGGQAISGAQPSAEWEKVLRELVRQFRRSAPRERRACPGPAGPGNLFPLPPGSPIVRRAGKHP